MSRQEPSRQRVGWGIYHLRDDNGRRLCGRPEDRRHEALGLRSDPEIDEPCPECMVAAVTAGD
jgi:hypothetical protein